MGDAFYRWDGVRYYATFFEFLPSIALVTILWSITAAFAAIILYLIVRLLLLTKWNVKAEDLLIFLGCCVLLVILLYANSKWIFKNIEMTYYKKILLTMVVVLASIFLTRLFRNKSERWISIISERITLLVWLFGIFVILSIPLVAYHTWWKETGRVISQKIQHSELDKKRPNIILVTFDALTAQDMSVYGYHRLTTPFINEWAKNASLFLGVKSGSNFTTPTCMSLMTGKRLWTHQTYWVERAYGRESTENIPHLLKKNGYSNIALQQIHYASVKKMGMSNSFDIVLGPEKLSSSTSIYKYIDNMLYQAFGEKIILYNWIIKEDFISFKFLNKILLDSSQTMVPPEKAFNKFLEIFDNDFSEPFFAWIHVYPPHDPYLPFKPYMGMFNSSPALRTTNSQMKIDRYRNFPQEKQPTVNTLRDRYDEFIRFSDKQFEDFITQLTIRNKLKNTVIILSADHGESFEHNYLGHGGTHLYEQLTHIPLIIKEPNQTKGKIINNLVDQVDITSTILELAQIPVPSWMEGRSLVPLLRSEKLQPMPVFAMSLDSNVSGEEITTGTIAVWEGDYKFIYYLESNKSLLFNLKKDPQELINIFDKEPEIGQHLLSIIRVNLEKANEKIRKRK